MRRINHLKYLLAFLLLLIFSGCSYKNDYIVERLDLNKIYSQKNTKDFAKAVLLEDINTMEIMIEQGTVDIDIQGDVEYSWFDILWGNFRLYTAFTEKRYKRFQRDFGQLTGERVTPIYLALFANKKKSFVKLLELGSNLSSPAFRKESIIVPVCEIIVQSEAYYSIDAPECSIDERLFFLEELLKSGADPNFRDSFRNLILDPRYTRSHKKDFAENYLELVKLLMSYGADPSLALYPPTENYPVGWGSTPLIEMANRGLFNSVYYVLVNSDTDIEFSYLLPKNHHKNPGTYKVYSLAEEINSIAKEKEWNPTVDLIQTKTYPYYIKTIELLKKREIDLILPEDLTAILDLHPSVSYYITPTYRVINGKRKITSIDISDDISETNLPDDISYYEYNENDILIFKGEIKNNRKRYFEVD